MNTTTRSGRFARLAGVGIGLISLGASIFTVGASAEEEATDPKPGTDVSVPLTQVLTKFNFKSKGWVDASLGGDNATVSFTDDFGGSLGQAGTEGEDAPGALLLSAKESSGDSMASLNWVLDTCSGGGFNSNGYCQDPTPVHADGQLRLGAIDLLRFDQRSDLDDANIKVEIRSSSSYATASYEGVTDKELTAGWETIEATDDANNHWRLTSGSTCTHTEKCSWSQVEAAMGEDAVVVSIQFAVGSRGSLGGDLQAVVDNFVYKFAERGTATDGRFRAWNPEERFYAQTVEAPPAKPQVSILNNGMTVNHRGVFTYGEDFEAFTVEVLNADGVTAISDQKVAIWRVDAVPGLPAQFLCDAVTNDQGIASCAYDGGSDPTFYDVKVRAVVKGDYGTKAVGKTAAMAYGSF